MSLKARQADLACRSEDRTSHDVRQRSAAIHRRHRRGDGRRVHRRDGLRPGHPRRSRRRRQRRRRHLPGGRPEQLHRDRRHRRVLPRAIRRATDFFVPTGVQYALEAYRGGFLVTDGHHNRVLLVTLDGEVTELITFGNIVPTGIETGATRSTWPRPAPSPTSRRTARSCRSAQVIHRHGGGLRRAAPRRRGVRPRSRSVRALAGRLRGGDPEGSPAQPNTGAS